MASTIKRPEEHYIRKFRPSYVGRDTIRTLLQNGYSLGICCKDCPRLIEWTPPELLERFEDRLDLRLADLVSRLACSGDGGCGSREVAVFPHLYDEPWTWPPSVGA
ncbi:hypothetical protein QO010_000697 [Caulobacter ginsengisoli]|uniref:Uncharacterized protein n=1 Tax=Caulobacter ginsengisoli TaxID=400775 RepID=A0ABU0ILV6_9CAUL|nr:hypothetical protein [Caulobacter ginsengisoli]MDQ0462949.1 hypothetical protein [Caulobacter ginsengisoli]